MIPDKKQLHEQYKKAPQVVQQFITSPELSDAFEDIRNTHKLHLDEADSLSSALNTIFLEIEPFEKFPDLLKEALEQNSHTYDAVLKDVNEKVFVVFRKKILEKPDKEHEIKSEQEPLTDQPSQSEPPKKPTTSNEASPTPIISTPVKESPLINKLEQTVKEKVTDVEIGEVETSNDSHGKKSPNYGGGSDPYREPIE